MLHLGIKIREMITEHGMIFWQQMCVKCLGLNICLWGADKPTSGLLFSKVKTGLLNRKVKQHLPDPATPQEQDGHRPKSC